jgi:hypothetical protein
MSSKKKEKKKDLELDNSLKSYIRKPTKIKAIRWTGENLDEIQDFCGDRCGYKNKQLYITNNGEGCECNVELNDYIVTEIEKSSELKVISQNNFIDFYEEFSDEFGLAGLLWGSLVVTPIELQKFLDEKGLDLSLELKKIQQKIEDESSKGFVSDELIEIKEMLTIYSNISNEAFVNLGEPTEIKEEMLTKDSNISNEAFVNLGEPTEIKEKMLTKDSVVSSAIGNDEYFDSSKMMAIGVKKEELRPYQIRIKNLTDEKLYDVDLFNYKHEKQNKIEYSCGMGVDYDKFLRILASNRLSEERVDLFRINAWCDYPKFRNKQLNSCLHTIYEEPNGISSSCPTGLGIYFSAYQMQSDIIDVRVDSLKIQLNNLLQLRLSYLMPETEMVITIFPSK